MKNITKGMSGELLGAFQNRDFLRLKGGVYDFIGPPTPASDLENLESLSL